MDEISGVGPGGAGGGSGEAGESSRVAGESSSVAGENSRMAGEQVIRVDRRDQPVGVAGKLAAHQPPGLLHRAFSVLLVADDGRLLLQRRAAVKYHFAGLWANSCCGHPRPGEETAAAAARRTGEELGVRPTDLVARGTFVYAADDPASGLCERELDHVFTGRLPAEPRPDPAEVSEVRLVSAAGLTAELAATPELFAPWLPQVLALASGVRGPTSVGRRAWAEP